MNKDFEQAAEKYAAEQGRMYSLLWANAKESFLAGCEHAAPKWIDVETELPPLGQIVQGWRRGWCLVKRVEVGETTLWHFDEETLYTYEAPTHWAPLLSSPPSIQKLNPEKK